MLSFFSTLAGAIVVGLAAAAVAAAVIALLPISVPALAALAIVVGVGIASGVGCYKAFNSDSGGGSNITTTTTTTIAPTPPEPPDEPPELPVVPETKCRLLIHFVPLPEDVPYRFRLSSSIDGKPDPEFSTVIAQEDIEALETGFRDIYGRWLDRHNVDSSSKDFEVFFVKQPSPGQNAMKRIDNIVRDEARSRKIKLSFGLVSERSPYLN